MARLYDTSDSILAQKLSQVDGVGQVFTFGSAPPSVRAEVNPMLLNKLGVGLDTVRNALNLANSNEAKGQVANNNVSWSFSDNDQLFKADQYRPLIIAYHNGGPVRLGDVAEVRDSVSDVHNLGLANGKPCVLVVVFRQPGANIIQTVDRVRALMPYLQSSISPAIKLDVVMDRTITVRASVKDIETTLLISIVLVILVVFVFLRTVRATIIPSIAVPLSLVGTFGGMYLLGYSLDNLSLMALAISAGFVVDDAIVVIGKHHALCRKWHGCRAGSLQRSGGNRLHRYLHERVAGCSVYPAINDGRHCGAAVSRVRRHLEHGHWGFPRGLADHDADHVR